MTKTPFFLHFPFTWRKSIDCDAFIFVSSHFCTANCDHHRDLFIAIVVDVVDVVVVVVVVVTVSEHRACHAEKRLQECETRGEERGSTAIEKGGHGDEDRRRRGR